MMSARMVRDAGSLLHRSADAVMRPAAQVAGGASTAAEAAPEGLPVQQGLLLRALVERFGGEVTAATLTRHRADERKETAPASERDLRKSLLTLADLGAVDLEPNGDRDLIVRLRPLGAALYN